MRKEFLKVLLINFTLIIVYVFILAIGSGYHYKDVAIAAGYFLLSLAILNIFLAVLVSVIAALNNKKTNYPKALLLFSALGLLCSFSLCSTVIGMV